MIVRQGVRGGGYPLNGQNPLSSFWRPPLWCKHSSRLIQGLPSQVVGSHWHSYSSGEKGGTDVGSRTLVCPLSDLGPDWWQPPFQASYQFQILQLDRGDRVSLKTSFISSSARFTDISFCVSLNYLLEDRPSPIDYIPPRSSTITFTTVSPLNKMSYLPRIP